MVVSRAIERIAAASHSCLDRSSRVAPSAKVQPVEVLLVHIVEDNHEGFCATIFTRLNLEGIAFGFHPIWRDVHTLFSITRLTQSAAFSAPIALILRLRVARRPVLHVGELYLISLNQELRIAISGLRLPCSHADTKWNHIFHLSFRNAPLQVALYHTVADVRREELLHPITGRTERLAAVEPDHVRTPLDAVLVDEDGRIAAHADNVCVVLHAQHKDSLAHGSIQVASRTITLRDGILARIDDGAFPVVIVKAVVLTDKPCRIAIVMLVEDVNGIVVTPLGIVRPPRFHVADALHLGEAGLDGVVEHAETLGIVVTLVGVVLHVIVVVLVTNLNISDIEGFWMTVLGTHLAIMARDWAVGVLKGTEALVNPRLQLI